MMCLQYRYTVTNMKDTADNKTSDMFKAEPKSNAERQKAYRQRQKENSGKRIDMHVDISTYNRLESLALYGNESMKEVIMRLIESEYRKQLNAQDGKFDKFLNDLINSVTL